MLNIFASVVAKGDRVVVIIVISSVVDSVLAVVMSVVNSTSVVEVLSLIVLDSRVVKISVVVTVVSGRLVR